MLFSVVRQLTVLTPQILGSGNVCVCLYVDLSARLFKKGLHNMYNLYCCTA